eukprot:jgi/Tetstr1/436515/TSEL_025341.t1
MAEPAHQAVSGPASSPGSGPCAEEATALGETPPTRGAADAATDEEKEARTGPAEPAGEAGGSGSKKAKGKKAGVPNWAPIEAVACVWAQLAQCDEEQIQDGQGLQEGSKAKYLSKALELKRQGRWLPKLSGGRTPEQSAAIRAGPEATPESFWGKADKLKASVINHIVPIWWQVKDDQRSGWDMTEFVKEALARYWRQRTGKMQDLSAHPPEGWTCPEWEVFLFLGPPGHDDPALKPISEPGGGIGGPSQRRAVKQRKRDRAASGSELHGSIAPTNSAVKKAKSGAPSETTMAEQNGNDTKDTAISPSKYAIDRMTQAIGDMGGAIRTQCAIMERQADSMTLTAEAAAKKAKIETLRLQLQIFPPGSVEYQNAYQELVDANRSVAQAADEAAEQDANLRNL